MQTTDLKKPPLFVPPEILEAVMHVIAGLNEGREESMMCVLVAVENGAPPTVISSVHPESLPDLFQFLIEHQKNASVTSNGEPVNQKRN